MAVHPVNTHPNSADILLRVSTDQQAGDTHYSLPSQLSACQAFAAARGWHVYSVQEDTITGETVNRPGFQAVLDHLAAGKVGRVIVYDVDRAGRDIFVGVTLLHACQEAGATLHIERMPDLELGTGSPTAHMHEMLFVMRLSQAAQELSSLRERTQRGRRERVRAGKPLIGPVPLFGYTFTYDDHGVKSGFMPDPIYAPIVQRIFAEVAAGVPLQHICDALNREGVPTRSRVGMAYAKPATRRKVARFWQHNAITAIIEHPAYHGAPAAMRNSLWREQVFDAETGQHRTRYHRGLRHGSEVTPLSTEVWPALVSPTLARQARERLVANQEEAKRRMDTRDREDALLRGGYVYCLACGKPMTLTRFMPNVAHGGKRFRAYVCSNRTNVKGVKRSTHCGQSIVAASLDAQVWAHVVRLAQEPEVAEQAMARWHAQAQQYRTRRAALLTTAERLLATAAGDEARLLQALTREADVRLQDMLRVQWGEAVKRKEAAAAWLATLHEQAAQDAAEQQYADVSEWAEQWRSRVGHLDYNGKRQMLHRLGLRVFVAPLENPGRAGLIARGLPGEEHRFVVVLGWPRGVREAVPWMATPSGQHDDRGTPVNYSAAYLPGLEDDHSEVAQLLATEPGTETDQGTETYTLAGVVGTRRRSNTPPIAVTLGTQMGAVIGEADAASADAADATHEHEHEAATHEATPPATPATLATPKGDASMNATGLTSNAGHRASVGPTMRRQNSPAPEQLGCDQEASRLSPAAA